jgi:hypothetical protein
MKKLLTGVMGAAALALTAAPALAHFSESAMFQAKETTLSATVKDFQFMAPLAWLEVEAPGQGGKAVEWSLVTEAPSRLELAGIKRNALKEGDQVTVKFRPFKDGRAGGRLVSVTKADGRVITPPPPIS